MKPEVLIKAGAILLQNAKLPKDILSNDVVARQWVHPALAEPVVRIPTHNMLRGIDLEMGLLGFAEATDTLLGKSVERNWVFRVGRSSTIPTMRVLRWTWLKT